MDPQELLHHFEYCRVNASRLPTRWMVFPNRAFHAAHAQDSASGEASDATMSGLNSESDDTNDTFVGLGPTNYFEGAAKVFDHNG